jgi:uncharacterized protein (DUF4415 family)
MTHRSSTKHFSSAPTSIREPGWSGRADPKEGPLEQPTTIRLDADVLAALRASGDGRQTRVSDAVRDLVKAGKL